MRVLCGILVVCRGGNKRVCFFWVEPLFASRRRIGTCAPTAPVPGIVTPDYYRLRCMLCSVNGAYVALVRQPRSMLWIVLQAGLPPQPLGDWGVLVSACVQQGLIPQLCMYEGLFD